MKKLVLLFLLPLFLFVNSENVRAGERSVIYFFYGQGCPHCAIVDDFFQKNDFYNKYPIEKKEIYFNQENALLYNNILDKIGFAPESRGCLLRL